MSKIKLLMPILCLTVLMSASSAYAVTEILKSVNYSLRNVQEVIEVVNNLVNLATTKTVSELQGAIGSIKPAIAELKSQIEPEVLAAKLPSEARALLDGDASKALPQLRSYASSQIGGLVSDVISQRDALISATEQLNVTAMDAISTGKAVAAKLNDAPNVNDMMLSFAATSKNQQAKVTQESALSIKGLENDVLQNKQSLKNIEIRARRVLSEMQTKNINGEEA